MSTWPNVNVDVNVKFCKFDSGSPDPIQKVHKSACQAPKRALKLMCISNFTLCLKDRSAPELSCKCKVFVDLIDRHFQAIIMIATKRKTVSELLWIPAKSKNPYFSVYDDVFRSGVFSHLHGPYLTFKWDLHDIYMELGRDFQSICTGCRNLTFTWVNLISTHNHVEDYARDPATWCCLFRRPPSVFKR